MKNIKKLLSIVMVLTLVLSLGASALAVDITITDANSNGSTYGAYRLLDLTTTAEAIDEGGFSYTVNPTYRDILKSVTSKDTDEEIIKYISELKDADALREFADKVFEQVKSMTPELKWQSEKTFKDAPQGYYLIAEKVADGTEDGVASLVMLNTAGRDALNVTTKEDKPSSEKKVKDTNDSTGENSEWQDSADYDIGDHVPFQLTATLPKDYETYDSYKLVFHDKESAGLTYDTGSAKVYVDGTLLESGYEVKAPGEDGCSFDVIFTDLREAAPAAKNGSKITVEYTSLLNDSAVIGKGGNTNEMHIEYSNDHYSDGTGKTPDDKVIVFTFDLDVNKVDGNGKPLTGAEFALYKEVAKGTAGAVQLTAKGEVVGAEGVEGTAKDADKWYVKVDLTKSDDGTVFTGEGLDDGNYVLVETVTPAGYNAIDPKYFSITAEHDKSSDDPQLGSVTGNDEFTFTLDPVEGKAMGQSNIVNQTGVELPSTGGIGTTIFYVVGGILVAAAVILLVTRRRVTGAEK